jgi:hypothetical protein
MDREPALLPSHSRFPASVSAVDALAEDGSNAWTVGDRFSGAQHWQYWNGPSSVTDLKDNDGYKFVVSPAQRNLFAIWTSSDIKMIPSSNTKVAITSATVFADIYYTLGWNIVDLDVYDDSNVFIVGTFGLHWLTYNSLANVWSATNFTAVPALTGVAVSTDRNYVYVANATAVWTFSPLTSSYLNGGNPVATVLPGSAIRGIAGGAWWEWG